MSPDPRQVVVYADAQPPLAYLVRDRLAEAGIEAMIENEVLQSGPSELLPAVIGPRVVVAREDACAARDIVAQFRAESSEVARDVANAQADGGVSLADRHSAELSGIERTHGPKCPECGRGRMTQCPYCGTASASFSPADQPPGAEDGAPPALLLCPTCDEAFAPVYHRRCEWCGHDFGEGYEIKPIEVVDRLNDRVTLAVVATGALLLVILGYFATLLK